MSRTTARSAPASGAGAAAAPSTGAPSDQTDNHAGAGAADTGTTDGRPKAGGDSREAAPQTAPPAMPKKRGVLRRFLLGLLVILGAAGGGFWYWITRPPADDSQLVLMGNIDVRQVNLSFKVDGRIESVAVDEGDPVTAGQVVATLDRRYFDDELRVATGRRDNLAANVAKLEHGSRPEEIEQARAITADREATLQRAREDFDRAKNLVGKGAVSRQEYDLNRSALTSAEAQVRAARESQRLMEIGPRQEDIDIARAQLAEQEATIVQIERRREDSQLVAPSDGVILTRARERGAIVQAGETVFALTLATPVWVRTYVNERDLGLIRPDMPAGVVTDSAPERPYPAKIGFISPTAEFTPKTVETRELRTDLVYRLRVVVDNPDGWLRQGMPVTVRVQLDHPRPKTFWERAREELRARLHIGPQNN